MTRKCAERYHPDISIGLVGWISDQTCYAYIHIVGRLTSTQNEKLEAKLTEGGSSL